MQYLAAERLYDTHTDFVEQISEEDETYRSPFFTLCNTVKRMMESSEIQWFYI